MRREAQLGKLFHGCQAWVVLGGATVQEQHVTCYMLHVSNQAARCDPGLAKAMRGRPPTIES